MTGETTKSDFAESHQTYTKSHQLRTVNERGHINSVPWLHAVTSTPYHEWTRLSTLIQFKQRIFWTNCVHSWCGVDVTAFIHGTELMRFGKVTLRSTKISIKWLRPVKVTFEVIKWPPMVFCWSCDEGPLKWDKKNQPSLQFISTDRISLLYSQPKLWVKRQIGESRAWIDNENR